MAGQLNILQLNSGIPIEDPTSGILYIVIGGLDYSIEYESLFKYIYRSGIFTSSGSTGQIVTYSTPFMNVKPIIFDPLGSGYDLISWDANGFELDTYGISDFTYLTIKGR